MRVKEKSSVVGQCCECCRDLVVKVRGGNGVTGEVRCGETGNAGEGNQGKFSTSSQGSVLNGDAIIPGDKRPSVTVS